MEDNKNLFPVLVISYMAVVAIILCFHPIPQTNGTQVAYILGVFGGILTGKAVFSTKKTDTTTTTDTTSTTTPQEETK